MEADNRTSTSQQQLLLDRQAVQVPLSVVHSLRTEFNIQEGEVESFILTLIEKAIAERIGENNAKVFSTAETKELEDDLKGLGYI